MRLLHLANLNSTNIGNGALIWGTERVLNEDLQTEISWVREPWDDYTFQQRRFDEEFIDKVNQSDGLIVNGAVTFNGREYFSHSGMRLNLPLNAWDRIQKPIIFYGVSYRFWTGQEYHYLDQLKLSLEAILQSEKRILAVRNDGTREWLCELLQLPPETFSVIPDPALFVPVLEDAHYPELSKSKKNIILSLNNEDASFRYHRSDKDFVCCRRNIVQKIAQVLTELIIENDLNLVLVPHYWDDYEMMSEFISASPPRLAHQKMVSTGLLRIEEAPLFYGRYAKSDLAISMRVHSISPCIGLGTPMIPVVTQDRIFSFLDNIGLSDLALDAFDPALEIKLRQAVRSGLEHSYNLRTRFKRSLLEARVRIRQFNSRIVKLL